MTDLTNTTNTTNTITDLKDVGPVKEIKTVVIYHGGCHDGLCGAWCLSLMFDKETTHYHAGKFNEPYPDVKNKDVVFVDFSYDLENTLKLLQEAKSVVILDHHKTAERLKFITDPRLTFYLDMTRSGAQMAWDYVLSCCDFSPVLDITIPNIQTVMYIMGLNDKERPWFVNDIGDRDLWKWEIPFSKETTKVIYSDPDIKNDFTKFSKLVDVKRPEYCKIGYHMNLADEEIYNKICKKAVDVIATAPTGEQWKARLVECDGMYASEVGNRLVMDKLCDFAVMFNYNFTEGVWYLSLRALNGTDVDLTKIIPLFDKKGGGHMRAAGMSIKEAEGNTLKTFFKPAEIKFDTVPN